MIEKRSDRRISREGSQDPVVPSPTTQGTFEKDETMLRAHAAAQTEIFVSHVDQVSTLTQSDLAERHAAVCDGAVRYLPDLRAFANSLTRDRHQADDLLQATLLRALDASRQFTPGTNFKAWSFTILRHAFYNRLRSPEMRNVALDECAGYVPMTEPGQEKTLEFCDLRRAFAQLGSDHRQSLLLAGVWELDYGAAAKICGVAKGTMKSRVSRARAHLKTLMDGGPLAMSRRELAPVSSLELSAALKV
jgi:RNA polymerase sigma-70 factor (ECF subfamily)